MKLISGFRICLTKFIVRQVLLSPSTMASIADRTMCDKTDKPYCLSPMEKLGAVVSGISLQKDLPQEAIEHIRRDVHKYGLLVFKSQGIISGERHVQISRWFGEPESTFYKHPKSPHPDVFRVSNINSEGCTNVGRTGWHIDGSFQPAPFTHSLYHIVNVPKQGATGSLTYSFSLASLSHSWGLILYLKFYTLTIFVFLQRLSPLLLLILFLY